MPIPSPFHPRTAPLCESLAWKDWSGYHAVRHYATYPEREYHAFRQTAGVIDVTPLFKYDVEGPDAAAFLARLAVTDVARLEPGRIVYTCWCDDEGKVVDDGTIWRLAEDRYRVTAAEPCLFWLERYSRHHRVTVTDVTASVAALSVQGPASRAIVAAAVEGPVAELGYFRLAPGRTAWRDVIVTRTGYTGDLGYEIWCAAEDAGAVWDAVMEAGRPHGLLPCGLDAMDVTRVEAGFVMNGVDYWSAHHCLIESRKSTPYELALGWTVHLDRAPFLGQEALAREKAEGPWRRFVGLDLDWDEYEALFEAHRLPPEVHPGAWRSPVPVYDGAGVQVGQATSGAWSPILKRNLALATVLSGNHKVGTELRMEVTVEYVRKTVTARVSRKPFFDPERKRA